ncbi:MAG: methylenetetrahydrofolate--tRNA-(uracil(54)-C(5))-methyltransferase (FADH(2)-oxidizing) TrmFO, partial [Synergistaceae bacterium]|nr:methylenetetrahydrofolate--tRNA-(uracil(54)-C(5))-methyltransferase (FADH(2)-oxidizing) TrmFO [Synergistaceae bacterium]
MTPAHKTDRLAEIVCSNSLGSENKLEQNKISAAGILKEELALGNSLILNCAESSRVPAGGALAVDRVKFSQLVTQKISEHKNIELVREKVNKIPADGICIIATGPLSAPELINSLSEKIGENYIAFFDAVAPVIAKESIDFNKAYVAGRYSQGDDYINCPLSKDEYLKFYNELVNAERALPHDFEKNLYFEGCMPIEVLADRGVDTMRYGPMKPVGLPDPKTGREPWAVVQLRQDNLEGSLYNIVGFQTGLKWGEQKRVFALIPGLENAEIMRYGVMHRNTSLNAPAVLDKYLRLKDFNNIFIAGQLTGVEGYMESTAMGLAAGINALNLLNNKELKPWPDETAIGSLIRYLNTASAKHFQPMNANLGIFPALDVKIKIKDKKLKARKIRDRAIDAAQKFWESI